MLKIHGRANSINVRKVLWVCDEIGLPYQRTDYGRGYTPTEGPEFQQLSPFALVPVIDDDGFILRESNTIVRYLAAKHARADLYPTELRARAGVEAWMDWSSTNLSRGSQPVMFGHHLKMPEHQDPRQIAAGAADWAKQMRRLDDHLRKHGPHLMGEAFTIADIPVALVVNRWFSIDVDKPELAAVSAYYEHMSRRPAFMTHGRNGNP